MCKIVTISIDGKEIAVADIKLDYIKNIVKLASRCEKIKRIVLFGSALEDRCSKESDIDLAVFGDESEGKVLLSKSYKDFVKGVFAYDFSQNYDILYFKNNSQNTLPIMANINKGTVLYEKA